MLPHHQGERFTHDKIVRVLREIDMQLREMGIQRKIRLYALGGTILVLENLRATSKDIDFIVSRKDFIALTSCVPQIEKRENVRIDLFPDGDLPDYKYGDYYIHARQVPLTFENMELYYIDKADFLLTKILAGRSEDIGDIERFVRSPEEIPLDLLRSRYKQVIPDAGKAEILKNKFETFVEKFYKAT